MYNFHPAVMFLGDSGSLVLGYLVAILAMSASLKSHATVALLIPILALGLPIMDTLLAILRRWSRRLPVSQADREHIHHRLLAMGFSHREAVVVLYCACIVLAAAALAVASASSLVVGLVLAGICVFGVLAVHFIGASELITFFERIGEMLRARGAEKLHSAAKKSAFHVMLSRSHDQVVEALQPYLAELPASRARIARPGLSHEPIVEIEGKPTTGGGRIEELFTLPGGGRLLLVVEGVEGTASQLPGEVRQALARVFSDMEGEDRGRQAAEDSSGVVSEGAA
jgi:UDP-GlcNAc:undecaprenyl-phosphate GlcNAc-1-phosphate transferase